MKSRLIIALIFVGIFTRFIFQFIYPAFNGDEINLGFNIKNKGFIDLLYPLDYFQSAPPLFLWLEKLFTYLPIPFWIAIKLYSFFVSVLVLFIASNFAKQFFKNYFTQVLFIAFIIFNPFIVYNTLTLKQYGTDLLFALIAVTYYNRIVKSKYGFLFFMSWCLISNIGLFFTVAVLVQIVFKFFTQKQQNLICYLQSNCYLLLKFLIAPLPYLVYFVWYMQQNGAYQMREFMLKYWNDSFIPFNFEIVKYCAYFFNGIAVYFISSYRFVSIPLLLCSFVGLGLFFLKKYYKINKPILFYVIAFSIHVFFNILHLYPLSDRLYLYLVPLVLYFLLFAIENFKRAKIRNLFYGICVLAMIGYATYLPFKENDVYMLNQEIEKRKIKKVFCTENTYKIINSFNKFTNFKLKNRFQIEEIKREKDLQFNGIFVSRVAHKFGHREKTAAEEKVTLDLISEGKLKLIDKIDGFNIYIIVK